VSYACSGGAIFHGLLTVQAQPPGWNDNRGLGELKTAQLEALDNDLCPPDSRGRRQTHRGPTANYEARFIAPNGTYQVETRSSPTFVCPTAARRRVDAMLLSTGGNDVGFSSVIFDALLPRTVSAGFGSCVLGQIRNQTTLLPEHALGSINRNLAWATQALGKRISTVAPGAVVVQSKFPDPTRSETGGGCGPAEVLPNGTLLDPGGVDKLHGARLVAINGVWPDHQGSEEHRWVARVDQRAEAWVVSSMIPPLNGRIAQLAPPGWRIVDIGPQMFLHRGWCAQGPGEAEHPDLPNWSAEDHAWKAWSPADWDPYARRARLFRTPNDAALTMISDRPRPFFGAWGSFLEPPAQPFMDIKGREALLYSLAGAFHPTFEAHMLMGLKVNEALEAALP
jgi:hypothetical protein